MKNENNRKNGKEKIKWHDEIQLFHNKVSLFTEMVMTSAMLFKQKSLCEK